MLASHADWRIWTDWYDARLAGAPADEDLEIARALIADEIWKQGPRAVNAEIARLIKEHDGPRAVNAEIARLIKEHDGPKKQAESDPPVTALPTIPPPRPAAIEPEIDEAGRIVLPAHPATSSLAEASVIAALKSLSEFMNELADAAEMETNVDKRMIKRLRDISAAIPTHAPDNVEVFSLGHRYEELAAYKASAEDSWPPTLAARFIAMTLAFDRTLRRFAEWRSFVSEPRIEKLGAGEAATIASLGRAVSGSLREDEVKEIVDPRLPQTLDIISMDLEKTAERAEGPNSHIELGAEELAQDVLESLNNILKRVAERGLMLKASIEKAASYGGHKAAEYGKAFVVPADKSLKKALKDEGNKFGPWLIKLLKRTVTWGGPAGLGLSWLIQHYPTMFSWLDGFIKFVDTLPK